MNQNSNTQKDRGIKEFLSNLFFPLTSTLDFLQKYFKGLILLIILLFFISLLSTGNIKEPNLMQINLSGTILDSDKILKDIKIAEKKSIKGVLFVVNSPGGAVAPSIEISYAIKRLREKKPVIVYASGTLASGSYYASIWANKIIANPGSIVGSIGVIFETPIIKGLLDKIGVEPSVVKAGKYKEIGTPFRPWKEYEKEEIKKVIFDTYDTFVKDVCKARGLKYEEKDKFAEAHIFTARGAKEVGLIDEVGTIYEAKEELKKISKVKEAVWKKPSKFEEMLKELSEKTSSKIVSLLFGFNLF
jgi:protease-4